MTKDGLIAIDKPEGLSSAAVVAIVKRKLGVKKVGHTGTLDPFATGLMLCGVNKGTKLSQFFLGNSKRYLAEIALGVETDTQDHTGDIINRCDSLLLNCLSHEKIMATVAKFKGIQMQNPPIYSALKHNGKPLYKLAREGNPLQKPPRKIDIHSIELLNVDKISRTQNLESPYLKSSPLFLTIFVHCSSGTYIRSLAHDIGQQLGCGASLSYLRRTETCGFSIDNAISINQLDKMSQQELLNQIYPMAEAIDFMPLIEANEQMVETIRFGRPFIFNHQLRFTDREETLINFRVVDTNGELVAIVRFDTLLDKYDYCCVFIN